MNRTIGSEGVAERALCNSTPKCLDTAAGGDRITSAIELSRVRSLVDSGTTSTGVNRPVTAFESGLRVQKIAPD